VSDKRREKMARLEREMDALVAGARALEERYRVQLDQLHPEQERSGLNLLHYLALRRQDVRHVQEQLSALGLSSLGRAESHVLDNLHAARHALQALLGVGGKRPKGPVTLRQGHAILRRHARALLGEEAKGSPVRIMVTLPVEAAHDPVLVRDLVEAGMSCARINCAQGGPEEWERMIDHVHLARGATGRPCRTFMDLAGPKIRTGPLVPGDAVLAIRPKKDKRGNVREAERVRLAPDRDGAGAPGAPPAGPDDRPLVPISPGLFSRLRVGARLGFVDIRGKSGCLEVTSVMGEEAQALCASSAYLEAGLPLSLDLGNGGGAASGSVGSLPPLDEPIVLHVGDTLVIHKDPRPGEPASPAGDGRPAAPAHVSCTLPECLDDARVGEPVVLDDGKARGVIRAVREGEIDVEITQARAEGTKLRANKGINFPETCLRVAGLTQQDKQDLRFVARHADAVNVSFVNHPDDVEDLLDELEAVGGEHLGLVLKIETRQGYQNLPAILLAAMEWPVVGVMIARGDLAVEVGWTSLARIQEEILWVCEAAHAPVVWATEVLDRLAKKGMPTRAEISDAVMAERAECVMLNKGPYIVEAIRTLESVLQSMQGVQRKKTPLLPALTLEDPDPTEVGRAVGLRQGRWTRRK
jgi:pyruvate kinase